MFDVRTGNGFNSNLRLLSPRCPELSIPDTGDVDVVSDIVWSGDTGHGERHVVRSKTQPHLPHHHIVDADPLWLHGHPELVDCHVVWSPLLQQPNIQLSSNHSRLT